MELNAIGYTRRLRALSALGYSHAHIHRLSGLSYDTIHRLLHRMTPTVKRRTARAVVELYEQISMVPGPSARARRRAAAHYWAPPLAWDDDDLDNPTITPPVPPAPPKRQLPWKERYTELRQLGYNDLEIATKFRVTANGLLRQLQRHGLEPSPILLTESYLERYKRERVS